jgi:hypothetical protein
VKQKIGNKILITEDYFFFCENIVKPEFISKKIVDISIIKIISPFQIKSIISSNSKSKKFIGDEFTINVITFSVKKCFICDFKPKKNQKKFD